MFGQREKPPALDRRRSLAGVPVLNEGVAVSDAAPGRVNVTVRVARGRGWLARFQPAVMERTVKLDELGTFVFRQIDGQQPVEAIVEQFLAQYRTNRREGELSTVAFLKSLAERGVISIAIR